MGRGGMASARRDAFFLDLERDGMDSPPRSHLTATYGLCILYVCVCVNA